NEIPLPESPTYRRPDIDIFIMSTGPSEFAGFPAYEIPPVGVHFISTRARRPSTCSAISAATSTSGGLNRRHAPIEQYDVCLANRAVRRWLDDMIHDVVRGVVRTETRTARERRELLPPFRIRPHELAVRGKQIGVVVSIVAARVGGKRVPVHEL